MVANRSVLALRMDTASFSQLQANDQALALAPATVQWKAEEEGPDPQVSVLRLGPG